MAGDPSTIMTLNGGFEMVDKIIAFPVIVWAVEAVIWETPVMACSVIA